MPTTINPRSSSRTHPTVCGEDDLHGRFGLLPELPIPNNGGAAVLSW